MSEPTLWDDLQNTTPCAEFPDVRVCEAVRLEIALRKIADDDEACDLVGVVLAEGWRPAAERSEPREKCACGHPRGWHLRGQGSCLECACLRFAAECQRDRAGADAA